MAFIPGYLTEVYTDKHDFTELFNSSDTTSEQDTIETPQFRKRGKTYIPGQLGGSASLEGLWSRTQDNGITDGPHEFFSGLFSGRTRVPVTIAYGGGLVGDTCDMMSPHTAKYGVKAAAPDAIRFSLSFTAEETLDSGLIAHARGSQTATHTGTAVDLGIDPDTAVAHLHVLSASGTNPTLDVEIEDSTDGASGWASVGTFTQKTAAGYQVITLNACKRYVRVKSTLAGTNPDFSYVVAVAPRMT